MRSNVTRLLDEARTAYAQSRWADAFEILNRADAILPLEPGDRIRLVWAAGMLDKDAEVLANFERLHETHLAAGSLEGAAYAAFFVGFRSMQLGEMGQAGAWLQKAQRLVEKIDGECAAKGYLMLPVAQKSLMAGDFDSARIEAAQALSVGERCSDADLIGFARCVLGRALARQGKATEGILHLDEAMLAASRGELSPIVTGHVYCSVIETCRQVYALDRAREWTEALAAWCDGQPQHVQFNGLCRVHRAAIMELNGAWSEATEEAQRARQRPARAMEQDISAAALYQEAEIHRLRGEFGAAETDYREANRLGWDPQPGLAILRLAQGHPDQAVAAIRRSLAATQDLLGRAKLLPAAVQILLAVGAFDEADSACREIEDTARLFSTEVIGALAFQARGAIALAAATPGGAITALRAAFSTWQKIGAPYLAARTRLQIGKACQMLGDMEGAALEWGAARTVFEALGAAPDVVETKTLLASQRARKQDGLTVREREVLGMVATGMTNRAIAARLQLSEKTVDRHVSNIFDKIAVPTRAAATAYAYKHHLV